MKKVNLFIVGAARCGTTSLWQILRQHPQIFMPADELYKEPAFFSGLRGLTDIEAYLRIFSDASPEHEWIGEASTAYLTDPVSAKRIYDYNPDARIIIMLRNPAERAYSLYNWMVQDGYEFAGTFQEALDLESKRGDKEIPNWFEPEYYWNYMYFQSGLYHEQLKRYIDLFGDKVLIIKFEDFMRDAVKAYDSVCAFLGLEKNPFDLHKHNPSRRILSPKIQFILRKLNDNFHACGRGLLLSGDEWRYAELFHEYARQLSSVTKFGLREKAMGLLVLSRIRKRLGDKQRLAGAITTKETRDRLLQTGVIGVRPRRISRPIKRDLLMKFNPDIDRLSRLTGLSFENWAAL
jgi:hypothetical protein